MQTHTTVFLIAEAACRRTLELALLAAGCTVAGTTSDRWEALHALTTCKSDVVVITSEALETFGVSFPRALAQCQQIPILILPGQAPDTVSAAPSIFERVDLWRFLTPNRRIQPAFTRLKKPTATGVNSRV